MKEKKEKEKKALYKLLIFLTKFFALRSKIYGLENIPENKAFIPVGNHNSIFDPLVITAALYKFIRKKLLPEDKKLYWIGNVALQKRLYLRFLSKDAGYLATTRKAISQSISLLEKGNVIGIFPEGSEHNEEKLRKGKKGVAYIVLLSGAPVIPVACQCPKTNSFFQGVLGLFLRKKITFGSPIYFLQRDKYYIKANPEIVDSTIDKIMREISQLCGKEYEF